jgi:predicted enzyme related to lactoylglutathione lyase
MHKSRLGTIVIDCRTDRVDEAAAFWSAALGWPARRLKDPNNSSYRQLEAPEGEAQVLVRAVDRPRC